LATGTTCKIKELASSNTEALNLEMKTVLPGLIDSHTHPALNDSKLLGKDISLDGNSTKLRLTRRFAKSERME
jgi:predicted amidohydrolase YtcJ